MGEFREAEKGRLVREGAFLFLGLVELYTLLATP